MRGGMYGGMGMGGGMYNDPMYGPEPGKSPVVEPSGVGPMNSIAESGFRNLGYVGNVVEAFVGLAELVSMNFEAMHMSFGSIIGLVDGLSTLRQHIWSALKALAVLKFVQTLLSRSWKHIRPYYGYSASSSTDVASYLGGAKPKKVNKALVVLVWMATVVGVPLLTKKLYHMYQDRQTTNAVPTARSEADVTPERVKATHEFIPQRDDELPLRPGDILEVAIALTDRCLKN